MNKPLLFLITGFVVLGCLSPAAMAQKKKGPKTLLGQSEGDTFRRYRLEKGEQIVIEDPGETYQPGTPVPLEKRVAIKGLGKYVQSFVGINPGRLAPGQSGEVRIVLALKGSYVLEDGVYVDLRYRREQGQFAFGNWTMQPPGIGKLKTVFQGLSVYDNTASIVIPVSVGAAAAFGERTVGFEIEVDVTNGETGIFHGRHFMAIKGKINVGPPLPVIQATFSGKEDAAAPKAAGGGMRNVASIPKANAATLSPSGTSDDLRSAERIAATSGPAGELDASPTDMSGYADSGSNLLIYSVPAILLLLLLAMALRRGRSSS